jgi:FixJ family two-component response regulator
MPDVMARGCRLLGAVDFLVKPFDRATLLAKLHRALGTEKAAGSS